MTLTPEVDVLNLFFFVTDAHEKQARLFVLNKLFQASLIFAILSICLRDRFLVLFSEAWKASRDKQPSLSVGSHIDVEKCFMALTPGANVKKNSS